MRKHAFAEYGLIHLYYANMPIQYAAILKPVKMIILEDKICYCIFLTFAQHIGCGYTLEPPQ